MARPEEEQEYKNPEHRYQRRQNRQNSKKRKIGQSGRNIAQTDINTTRKKLKDMEKSLLLGKINKMILKQNAMEDAAGTSLPSTTPQQAQNMGMPQSPPQQGQAPQSNPQMNFDATGGVAMSPEIQKKLDGFNALDEQTRIKMINTMNPHDPDNYQIIKFSATRGAPEVQGVAAWKLNLDDLEELIQPTMDNAKAVSALALKTNREENWAALAEHSDALVRRALVRNRNIEDMFLKDMYDDTDLQVRINIIDKTFNQDLLHLFIADKSFYVLKRLMPKLDSDGLKILARHANPQIRQMAQSRKSTVDMEKLKRPQKEGDKINNSDDEFVTAGDKHNKLPDYTHSTAFGFGMGTGSAPAMIQNSLVVKIDNFLTKAEIIQKEGSLTVADTFTPTANYSGTLKKKIADNLHFKSEDGVEGILNIVKSVGEEFFGEK